MTDDGDQLDLQPRPWSRWLAGGLLRLARWQDHGGTEPHHMCVVDTWGAGEYRSCGSPCPPFAPCAASLPRPSPHRSSRRRDAARSELAHLRRQGEERQGELAATARARLRKYTQDLRSHAGGVRAALEAGRCARRARRTVLLCSSSFRLP